MTATPEDFRDRTERQLDEILSVLAGPPAMGGGRKEEKGLVRRVEVLEEKVEKHAGLTTGQKVALWVAAMSSLSTVIAQLV